MGKRILFSPIGGTDPIKYYRDGSMLHICRHYQPDIVYMYLSKEMLNIHEQDNRYVATLAKLGEHLNHNFEVRLIKREMLVDVQQYDVFYKDFREEIGKIEAEMETDDELMINMASGTPAMKSALLVMATLAEYRFKAIQVSTPLKQINEKQDDRTEYDVDFIWECNEDNEAEAPNRCTEVKCLNLIYLLKLDMIKRHIDAYDYSAALHIAEEIKAQMNEDAYQLLLIASERVKLNSREISKLMARKKFDLFPINEGNKKKLFEYALVLQLKIEREEYADFIRGITPLVVDLLENILKNYANIALEEYCSKTKTGMRWKEKKLKEGKLWSVLDEAYRDKGGFRGGVVYSHHIASLIRIKCKKNKTVVDKVNEMIEIEGLVRNVAAHEIISVTDEWFMEKTGKSAKDIFAIIKYLVRVSGIAAKEEDWKSYENMNHFICEELYKI